MDGVTGGTVMGGTRRRRVWWFAVAALAALVVSTVVLAMPRAKAVTEVHLTAAGDFGARAATATVLDRLADLEPDAHLALGDLAYRDLVPETAWCSYVKQRVGEGFPFELISGNHDSLDVNDGQINDFSACLPNQVPGVVGVYGREYYMDFPQGAPLVRVIQVSPKLTFEDGMWNYAVGDAHYNWLSNAIDDGRAKGAQWIVVSSHIPCFSLGQYSCPGATGFYQLVAAKKVDLVLHAHEHGYMRTHQLRSGVTGCTTIPPNTFNATCVADNDNAYTAGQGTVFATVGTGGTPLRNVNTADTEAGYFAAYSGLNSNPAYGLLDFTLTDTLLTARFVATSGTYTDAFTIAKGAPPTNQPPTAAFTTQVTDLSLTVNGSTSTDTDGTIVAYDWDFGDGGTATGVMPAPHSYASAGSYPVTLTVRDDDGAVDSTTTSVTVTDPVPATTLAQDQFSRTLASGWGTTTPGGTWTVSSASQFSVNGAEGAISSTAGSSRSAYLRSVTSSTSDLLVTLGVNKVPGGGGLYASAVGRSIVGAADYRAMMRFLADGRVSLRLARVAAGGTDTTMQPETIVPGLTYTVSDRLLLRVQVTGTNPTTVRAKIWKLGAAEPAGWTLSTTDATANLQAPGSSGVATYLSSSAANAPVVLLVDNYLLTQP
jgi:PKD repeat protein